MIKSYEYKTSLPTGEALFVFYEKMGWNDILQLSQKQLLMAMKQTFYAVYVYADDEFIATGRIVSDGVISAYMCGLGVLPEYRNQGIGTEITNRLKAHCAEHNLRMQFFCEEDLVPFYSKMGFEQFAIGMR